MINDHDDFEANSSVVLLTTFVFYIVLFCVLWTKSTAGDETIPIYGPVAGSGRVRCGPVGSGVVRCGPMRSGAVNSQTGSAPVQSAPRPHQTRLFRPEFWDVPPQHPISSGGAKVRPARARYPAVKCW